MMFAAEASPSPGIADASAVSVGAAEVEEQWRYAPLLQHSAAGIAPGW
jgi:hypothetical protein